MTENEAEQWTTNGQIDQLVSNLFLTEAARKETNLQYVRENVLASPRRANLLKLYRQILRDKTVPENEQSIDQNRLKLFGLVRVDQRSLKPRNEIYRQVFSLAWVKRHTPVDWTRRIAVAAVAIALILAAVLGYSAWQQSQQTDEVLAQAYEDGFNNTTNPTLRLDNLANLFNLPGFDDEAHALFNTLSPDEKFALFTADVSDLQPQVGIVVRGAYVDLENTESDNKLLQVMQAALVQSTTAQDARLAEEIARWLNGRTFAAQNNYEDANIAYSAAIYLNDQNPATHFERALVLTTMEDYSDALADFESVLNINEDWKTRIRQIVETHQQLHTTLWRERRQYSVLVVAIPTPTNTPTPTQFLLTLTPTPLPPSSTPTPTNTPTNTPTSTSIPTNTPLPSTSTPSPTKTFTPSPPPPLPTSIPTPIDETARLIAESISRSTLGDDKAGYIVVNCTTYEIDWYIEQPRSEYGFVAKLPPYNNGHCSVSDVFNIYAGVRYEFGLTPVGFIGWRFFIDPRSAGQVRKLELTKYENSNFSYKFSTIK